jgi:hypothetical protein
MKWSVGLLLLGACGSGAADEELLPSVERALVIRTSPVVSNARAEREPEAPPFRDEDAMCQRAGSRYETFWDPSARACRLIPGGAYAGAGCMSGGGGGLSVYAPPESVGLACMTGTYWSGCTCGCDGTWDALQRQCKP